MYLVLVLPAYQTFVSETILSHAGSVESKNNRRPCLYRFFQSGAPHFGYAIRIAGVYDLCFDSECDKSSLRCRALRQRKMQDARCQTKHLRGLFVRQHVGKLEREVRGYGEPALKSLPPVSAPFARSTLILTRERGGQQSQPSWLQSILVLSRRTSVWYLRLSG